MATVRVGMAPSQPQQRHFVAARGHYPQPALQQAPHGHQQWYVRQQMQQMQTAPQQQQPVRRARASAAPEVHQRHQALLAEHERQKVLMQRGPRQARRQSQVMMEEELQLRPVQTDHGGRVPQPLPFAWRAEYELCPCYQLGGGAFAEVFRVRHRHTHQGFAVKVMHRPNFAMRGIECQIDSEIEAMRLAALLSRDLREELYILRLVDDVEEGEYVYLLLELCDQGDLLRKLSMEPYNRLSEEDVAVIARQLMIGLSFVHHKLKFIHRDIKPDNLLYTTEGLLRIADFGWCCPRSESPTCLAGTLLYMAPEVLSNERQTVQADVWSAGMTLFQMMVGKPLLSVNLGPGATRISEQDPHRSTAIRQQWLLQEIGATCPPPVESRPSYVSAHAWDLVRLMLVIDPNKRITVEGALQHPWLKAAAMLEERKEALKNGEKIHLQDQQEAREENLAMSPVPSRHKEVGSPPRKGSKEEAKEAMQVPTPSKPRSYDPSRNMAYTPPVSPTPELTPERTRWQQSDLHLPEKENSTDPEVSPERKMRLQQKADKVSGKDQLSEKQARHQISKLASPLRSPSQRNPLGSKPHRKTIASQMPTRELKLGGSPHCVENMPWNQIGDGLQQHLEKLATAKQGLEQLEKVPEEGGHQPGGYSSVKVPLIRDQTVRSPFPEPADLLTTSAPASRFHPRAPVAEKTLLTPRAAERNPQVGAAVGGGLVPPLPGNNRTAAAGAKVVHQAFCLSPQQRGFPQGSPLRSRVYQAPVPAPRPAAPVQNTTLLTQVRAVPNQMYAPSNGATRTMAGPLWGRQSPQRLQPATFSQTAAHRRQSAPEVPPQAQNIRL